MLAEGKNSSPQLVGNSGKKKRRWENGNPPTGAKGSKEEKGEA